MTLDEAIRHAEEVAEENEGLCEQIHPAMQWRDYGKCASEHRQLAEWLKDYKWLKEQETILDKIRNGIPREDLGFPVSAEYYNAVSVLVRQLSVGEVLDKIRAEIQELCGCSCSCSDGIIDEVEDILDKYKAESEVEE